MTLSVAVMGSRLIWDSQRPTDEEVQRRMQEGMEVREKLEEVRKTEERFKTSVDRAFPAQSETDR